MNAPRSAALLLALLLPFGAAAAEQATAEQEAKTAAELAANLCRIAALGNEDMINAVIDRQPESKIKAMRASHIAKFKRQLDSEGDLDAKTKAETVKVVGGLAKAYYEHFKEFMTSSLDKKTLAEVRALKPAERKPAVEEIDKALYQICVEKVTP
ncbi:MAG: hypothetical protein Q3966_02340 [Neisseria sp.]|nr:hypothetical protein [Neisseria sp.]